MDADWAEQTEKRLLDVIEDLVAQFAGGDGVGFDSMAISALADVMRILAAEGRLVIERETGRRVLARRP